MSVLLKKRTGNDIWKNLFDFPLIETWKPVSCKQLALSKEWNYFFSGRKVKLLKESKMYRHFLTHQVIIAKFHQLELYENIRLPYLKVRLADIANYPVPRLVEKFLESESPKWQKAK
jgi:A/G-specific adenine glycosylase